MDKPKTPTRPSGIPRLAASRLPLPTSTASRPIRPSPSREKLKADPGLDAARLRRPSEESLFKKPLPKYSKPTQIQEPVRRRDVSQAGTSDGGRSEAASDVVSIAEDAENRGRREERGPSLSDRTIETLAQIPPSPGSARRQSSFFNGASPIRSPSRPTSSMSSYSRSPSRSSTSRQQSGSSLLFQPVSGPGSRLPSRSRIAAPSLTANGTSHDQSSVESPSRLKKPSSRQSLGPGTLPSATKRPDPSPARSSLFGGTRTSSSTRPAPAKTLKPGVSDMGPPPQPLNVKKIRKAPSTSSTTRSPSTASKASTSSAQELTPEQESEKETRKVSKSSNALRESIAKAKAARKAARQSSGQPGQTGPADPWENVEDPFNQKPKDPSHGLMSKRLEAGRTTGNLNVAAMSLTEFPQEVMTMYDFDPNTNADWYESVDLVKFIAADNELAELPDTAFPDIDPYDFDPDVDEKGNQFGGLEVLDLHGNVLRSLPIGFRRLQRVHTLNLSGNNLGMNDIQVVLEMESLKDLKLGKNQLDGPLTSEISRLKNLESLDLRENSLTELPESLEELTSLRVLNIGQNQLTSLPFEALSKIPLKELIAPKNKLQGTLIPASLHQLETLQTLDVTCNALDALSENEDLKLPNIQDLSISLNRIRSLPNVSSWKALLSLLAEDNRLTELPAGLVQLKHIRNLDVTGNNISRLDERIGLMDSLVTLRVANNPMRERKFLNMHTEDIKRDLRNRCEPEPEPQDTDEEGSVATQFTLAPEEPEQEAAWQLKPGGVLDKSYSDMQEVDVDRLEQIDPNDVRCLYLQHNQLRSFPIPALHILHNLTDLDLSHNPLDSSALLSTSLTLPNLQSLNLSASSLTSIEKLLTNLSAPSLGFLDVSCNRLNGALPAVRQSFPKLTAFIAGDNKFTNLEFESVQGLQVLDIGNNNIDHLPPKLGLLRAEGSPTNWGDGSALKRFEVAGNSFRVPRWQIVAKGTEAILEWLKERILIEDLRVWEPDSVE